MKKAAVILSRILLGMIAGILILAVLSCVVFLICDKEAEKSARTLPSYEQQDITEVLDKEKWTDDDYDLLYHQTGLGKSALDELKGNNSRILAFQEALFNDVEVKQSEIAVTTKHDYTSYGAPMVELQDGDVIVTSACHTFGWRNGHAAIVVDGDTNTTLESYSLGVPSDYGTTTWFRFSSNFIVLRLKDATQEERAEIAQTALERLYDTPYSLTVGIFSKKDQGETPSGTHCSHLVWQAFYYFGYDIDSDGGPVCTARDIANSEYFEVLQVYGFDPDELW